MDDVVKFFNMVTAKWMPDLDSLLFRLVKDGRLGTLGRDHFTPCYMYTCSRFFVHALTDRLRHGAIKRFDARTESRLMRGSNLHYRWSKAGSKVNHERAGYIVVGSRTSTRLVLLDFLIFSELFYAQADLCLCSHLPSFSNNPTVPVGFYTSFYFLL